MTYAGFWGAGMSLVFCPTAAAAMHPPVLALPDLRIAVRLSSLRAIYLRGPSCDLQSLPFLLTTVGSKFRSSSCSCVLPVGGFWPGRQNRGAVLPATGPASAVVIPPFQESRRRCRWQLLHLSCMNKLHEKLATDHQPGIAHGWGSTRSAALHRARTPGGRDGQCGHVPACGRFDSQLEGWPAARRATPDGHVRRLCCLGSRFLACPVPVRCEWFSSKTTVSSRRERVS